MNRNILLMTCLAGLLLAVPLAQTDKLTVKQEADERLVYKAKFLGITLGNFTVKKSLTTYNDRPVYRFEIDVKTLPILGKILPIKDRYVSYMDAEEFVTLRAEEYIKGGELLEGVVDFDYEKKTATYKNVLTKFERVVAIPDKIFDVISAGFYLTMISLEMGDTVELAIYGDGKIYRYVGTLDEKTTVRLPLYGRIDAYHLMPKIYRDGKQIKKMSGEVYITTTEPTQALRATLKAPLGKVSVILTEGLKNRRSVP